MKIQTEVHDFEADVKLLQAVEHKVPNGIIFTKESGRSFEGALSKAVIALKLELLRYKAKRISYGLI